MGSTERPAARNPSANHQTLTVPILSILIICLSAIALGLLSLPAEVTGPMATAAGALVPVIAVRRSERRLGSDNRLEELSSGSFGRPPVYVLFMAGGILAATEYLGYLLFGFFLGVLAVAQDPEIEPAEIESLFSEEAVVGVMALSILLLVMLTAGPVGVFVAHRVSSRPVVWALGAVLLSQVGSLVVELIAGTSLNPAAFLIWPLTLAVPAVLGVRHGTRTRNLFLAKRLFNRLREVDRAAVLSLMHDVHVESVRDARPRWAAPRD